MAKPVKILPPAPHAPLAAKVFPPQPVPPAPAVPKNNEASKTAGDRRDFGGLMQSLGVR